MKIRRRNKRAPEERITASLLGPFLRNLFYFLFQIFKKWVVEECAQAEIHTVANFLNSYDSRILAFGIEHAVNGEGAVSYTHLSGLIPIFLAAQMTLVDEIGIIQQGFLGFAIHSYRDAS